MRQSMKTRLYNLIIGIFAMLIANLVYFFWMPYPKSFLKTIGITTFIFDFITNLLYFAIYSVILIVTVNSIVNTGIRLRKKKVLAAIGVCIVIQLGCDIIRYIAEYLLGQVSPISNDFFTVISILVLTLAMVRLLGIKTVNYKRLFAVFIPVVFVALTVCIIFDIRYINNMSVVADKYFSQPTSIMSALSMFDESSVAATISKNMEYSYGIRNAVLDFVAESSALFSLYYSSKLVRSDTEKNYLGKAYFVSRIAAFMLLSGLICGLKFLVLPQNFLKTTHMQNFASYSATPSFTDCTTFISVRRAVSYKEVREIYRKTHVKLYYDKKKMLDIYLDYEFEGNPIETWTVNNSEVKIICHNQAVAYVKNGEPYAISFSDIEKHSKDDILLEVCKELLKEGRTDCFEYIGKYVMHFEPEFSKPYIERYKEKDFTESELQHMGDISPEYIARCAYQILK